MPTKTITKVTELGEPHVIKHTRSDLAKQVRKYWVGVEKSNIGMQYLKFKDGRVQAHDGKWERKDLLLLSYDGVTAFVKPTNDDETGLLRNVQTDLWDGVTLSETERAQIHRDADNAIKENLEFWAHEVRFLKWIQENWKRLDGTKPEECAVILESAGW